MGLRIGCLTIDAREPLTLGRFWAAVLGWSIVNATEESAYLVPREAVGTDASVPGLLLLRCRTDKMVKNRVHLDLRPDDQEADVARLEGLGATRCDIGQKGTESWIVMADPEGNEFCVLESK